MDRQHHRGPSVWMRRNQILIDPHRFLGIHMHELHEPAWLVRADRDHHKIERTAALADLTELRMICRIASEEHPRAAHLEGEAAPERLVTVAEPSRAHVPRR